MNNFIDCTSDKWFFNDVTELINMTMPDGTKFYSGIPYKVFETGKEAFDVEFVYTSLPSTIKCPSMSEIDINKVVVVTSDSPFMVYIDNVLATVEAVLPNAIEMGWTRIKLKRSFSTNAIVRMFYSGVVQYADGIRHLPAEGGVSGVLPNFSLVIPSGYVYEYDPFNSTLTEIAKLNGKQLKRVGNITDVIDWECYTVDESTRKLHVHYTLNGERIEFLYVIKDAVTGLLKSQYMPSQRAYSENMVYTNRFFPSTLTSRAEIFTLFNLLRKYFISKYTDGTPFTSSKTESRFDDVNTAITANYEGNKWWWHNVRDLEDLKLSDGTYLLNGYPANELGEINLGFGDPLTRAQMVVLLNKFRAWYIEILK